MPVRYLNQSKSILYQKFHSLHPTTKLSLSSFYKKVPYYYKKLSKKTDMCQVCVDGQKNQKKITKFI